MSAPQGYLSPRAASYDTGDIETTILRYVPAVGASVPLVDGSGALVDWLFCSSPLDAGLCFDVSNLAPGSVHDVYASEHSGAVVLGLLPWSAPRGYGGGYSGAFTAGGSPALVDIPYYGVPVIPAAAVLMLPGIGNTLAVAQYRATYLGTIRIADDAALLRCLSSYGEKREWGIWNRHNQRTIRLKAGDTSMIDPAHLYVYQPSVWGVIFGNVNAHAKVFTGRPQPVYARYCHNSWNAETSGYQCVLFGAIGWNSQDTPSGNWIQRSNEGFSAGGMVGGASSKTARYCAETSCGLNTVYGLVKTDGPPPVPTAGLPFITMGPRELRMLITVEYQG